MTTPPRRPWLLTIGAALATFFAAVWLVTLVGYAVGGGEFSIDGEPVPRAEFFARGGAWLLLCLAVLCASVVGTWRRRWWAREAMLLFWVVVGAMSAALASDREQVITGVAVAAIALVLAALYLYGAKGPRTYFAALQGRAERQVSEPPAG